MRMAALNHSSHRSSLSRRGLSCADRCATKKLGLASSRKCVSFSTLRWSMLDQNKLATAKALKEIINRTGELSGIGLILPETTAHATKQKVAVRNRRVKSMGKPRSSGKFL